ncbi:hypothetical protein [Plastorhodobacter daqingensis]
MIFTPYGDPQHSPENLVETDFLDFRSPSVQAFIEEALGQRSNPEAMAVDLFYAACLAPWTVRAARCRRRGPVSTRLARPANRYWRLFREAIHPHQSVLKDRLCGAVEVDESYFGPTGR